MVQNNHNRYYTKCILSERTRLHWTCNRVHKATTNGTGSLCSLDRMLVHWKLPPRFLLSPPPPSPAHIPPSSLSHPNKLLDWNYMREVQLSWWSDLHKNARQQLMSTAVPKNHSKVVPCSLNLPKLANWLEFINLQNSWIVYKGFRFPHFHFLCVSISGNTWNKLP